MTDSRHRSRRALPLTRTPWFAPKRYLGWGWRPANAQGWAVTGLFVVLLVGVPQLLSGLAGLAAVVVIAIGFLVCVVLTGGRPGGPGVRERG